MGEERDGEAEGVTSLGVGAIATLSTAGIFLQGLPVLAQYLAPAPDGTGTIITSHSTPYNLSGSTQANVNLFRSFLDFTLGIREITDFLGHSSLETLLGRVTGSNPSIIDGLLQVRGAESHRYLMNSASLVFGVKASLKAHLNTPLKINISGNLLTTDRMGAEIGRFSATGVNAYTALVSQPHPFGVTRKTPGTIADFGHFTTEPQTPLMGDTVPKQETLVLTHGEVAIAVVPGDQWVQIPPPGMMLDIGVSQIEPEARPLALPPGLTGDEKDTVSQVVEGNFVVRGEIIEEQVELGEAIAIVIADNTDNYGLRNHWLQHEHIANYQAQLPTWGNPWSDNLDCLLCREFTAIGSTDETLITPLTNLTELEMTTTIEMELADSTIEGVNWEVEVSTDSIPTENALTAETMAQWDSKRATLIAINAEDDLAVDGGLASPEAISTDSIDAVDTNSVIVDAYEKFGLTKAIVTGSELNLVAGAFMEVSHETLLKIDRVGTRQASAPKTSMLKHVTITDRSTLQALGRHGLYQCDPMMIIYSTVSGSTV